MNGLEPRTSVVWSNHSTNWATITANNQKMFMLFSNSTDMYPVKIEYELNIEKQRYLDKGYVFMSLFCLMLSIYSQVRHINWKICPSFKLIFKWANPGLFFIYFRPFKHTTNFMTKTYVKKCLSSIQCRHSNSRPLEHESLSITSRPVLNYLNSLMASKMAIRLKRGNNFIFQFNVKMQPISRVLSELGRDTFH